MSEAACSRCNRPTADGWCGYCLAWCDQPPGDPPPPPVPGKPRAVYDRAGEIARQATGREDGPAHDAVESVVVCQRRTAENTTCRSCHAPIRWVRTRAGKAMPLDATPSAVGNVVLGEDGTARVLTRKQVEGGGIVGERYVSHYATCPNAERHRR